MYGVLQSSAHSSHVRAWHVSERMGLHIPVLSISDLIGSQVKLCNWWCSFKDTGAAPLYERAGFREVKRDMWLLPLIGYERRFLMAKDLPRTPQ